MEFRIKKKPSPVARQSRGDFTSGLHMREAILEERRGAGERDFDPAV